MRGALLQQPSITGATPGDSGNDQLATITFDRRRTARTLRASLRERNTVKLVGCSNCTIWTRPKERIKDLDKTLRSSSPPNLMTAIRNISFPREPLKTIFMILG